MVGLNGAKKQEVNRQIFIFKLDVDTANSMTGSRLKTHKSKISAAKISWGKDPYNAIIRPLRKIEIHRTVNIYVRGRRPRANSDGSVFNSPA